jgi:nitrogenase molybdenum-cofactor synthesis protein NifE
MSLLRGQTRQRSAPDPAGTGLALLEERRQQIVVAQAPRAIECERKSAAGGVSQRACVFCGSRVVLYPVADALHLVHGPIGCAAYTWDIRGSLSSGPQLHRLSFSTDLREREVVYGGEASLAHALDVLIREHRPQAAFVYTTCIVGLIGDDVDAVCRRAAETHGIPVITVAAPGFAGTKKTGYAAACDALARLVGTGDTRGIGHRSLNILGEFNLAGEAWEIRRWYETLGLEVVATITGDGRVGAIRRAHGAALNVVQCSGSMLRLAQHMQERYAIPFIQVSYVGLEDSAEALYAVARHFQDDDILARARDLVRAETAVVLPELRRLKPRLRGKAAAIYTGGAFKAISLVRCLRALGMRTVLAGSQTGNPEDYAELRRLCDPDTVIVDDLTAPELVRFLSTHACDLLIGGVKERPIAYKLGVAFCDHNHERKHALNGFAGMTAFGREIDASVNSPVWSLLPRRITP